jgi:hypothetical protein
VLPGQRVDPGDGGPVTGHDVAVLTREDLSAATAGLRLDEAHQVLSGIQQHLVTAQAVTALDRAATTFPLGRTLQAGALRRRATRTAGRLEAELGDERVSFIDTCPRDWEALPRPDLPLVVGLDGGYVHSSAQTFRRDGWFEIIAGRSLPTGDGKTKCFADTQTYDTKPRRRLYELLTSQGM